MSLEKEGSCWCHSPREGAAEPQPAPADPVQPRANGLFLCSDRGRAIETLPVSSTKQVIPPHSHLLGMCGGLVRPSHEVFSFPSRHQDDGTACVGASAWLHGVSKASLCTHHARHRSLSLFPCGFVPPNLQLQHHFQQDQIKTDSHNSAVCILHARKIFRNRRRGACCSQSWLAVQSAAPLLAGQSPFHPHPRAALEVSGMLWPAPDLSHIALNS